MSYAFESVQAFMSKSQKQVIKDCLCGEERAGFEEMISDVLENIRALPKIYESPSEGKYMLHYFTGGSDWFIREYNPGDLDQVYGYAILNGNLDFAEHGYISINELVQAGAELDLHWTPVTLKEIQKGKF